MSLTSLHESQHLELRTKGIALVSGLSTAQVGNDTIYIFGGGQSNLWSLNTFHISQEYSEQEIQATPPLHWMYASPGMPWVSESENHTSGFLVVGTAQPTDPYLTIQFFNPLFQSWSLFSSNTTTTSTTPTACRHHSSFLLSQQQRILVYGGENSTHAMGHFWSYGIQTQTWTPLELPHAMNAMRCGHSASLLDDGRLVILGGWVCSKDQLLNDNSGASRPLADMSKAVVYDTLSGQWFEQPTVGPYPQPRAYHTAVKSTMGSVVIIGGQDGTPPPYQVYVSSNGRIQDMVAILNTTTWQWTLVPGTATMHQPLPQSMAAIGLMVDDHRLLFGYGTSYQTVYSSLYLFDVELCKWIPPLWDNQEHGEWMAAARLDGDTSGDDESLSNSTHTRHVLHIVLACVGTVCFLTVLLLLYRMGRHWKQKLLACLSYFKSKLWKPRIGEPSWTESVRLTMMFVYLCFFLFLIFCLADQVVNSPIIDQVSYIDNPSSTVNAPDIRFCLDDEHSVIRCGTDLGMQCSDYLITMPGSMRRHRNQHCYLFRAPPSFKLGQTSDRLASNGSYLKFDYYFGQPSELEVVFYNTHHNPNLAVYSIQDPFQTPVSPPFAWKDPMEETTFRLSEKKGALMKNIYQLDVNVVSSGSYELLERATLLDTFWNYVGFSPDVETFYEIDTKVQSETSPSDYSSIPRPLGSFHVYPRHYEIKTLHEQRAFAMVNATGVFGGLFGLLVSLQACLFGYRPRSPLGVVHRWSVGDMKRSLLNGLQKSFIPQTTNVPIIHPMRDPTIHSTMMLSQSKSSSTATTLTPRGQIMRSTVSRATLESLPKDKMTTSNSATSSLSTMQHSITGVSMKASSPTISPSPTLPQYTPLTQKPARAATRHPSFPKPFLMGEFVDEPDSYDDDDENDLWIMGAERLTRMEDRLEVLEKVFQAYYIDDEIFAALGAAAHQTEALPPPATHMNQPPQQRRRPTLRFRTPFKRQS